MAAGTRRPAPQDRVTVHASLDVFGVSPKNAQGGDPPHRVSSTRRAAQPRKDGTRAVSENVGYATRHSQRHSKQESKQKKTRQGVLSKADVGVVTTTYLHGGREGQSLVKPGPQELQNSMAATYVRVGARKNSFPVSRDRQYVNSPPQWRAISAVHHSSAPPHDCPTTPPGVDEGHGRSWQGTPPRYDERAPFNGNQDRYFPRYQDGGENNREEGSVAQGRDHGSYEAGRAWGGLRSRSPQQSPYYTEAPEQHHLEPEVHSRGGGDSGHGVRGVPERGYDGGVATGYGPNRYGEGQYSGGDEYHGSRGDRFGRENDPYSPPVDCYHQDTRRLRRSGRGEEAGCTTSVPGDGSSSGSDGRSDARRVNPTEGEHGGPGTRHDAAKRVEFAATRPGYAQEKGPDQSLRRQQAAPTSLAGSGASPGVRQEVKFSPARRRQSPCASAHTGGRESRASSVRRHRTAENEKKKTMPEVLNEALVKNPSDMLLFSKKARQVEYKPCTLKEYRETKPTGYVELGKLQPDLQTDELVAKRANAERVKEFSSKLRQINLETAVRHGPSHSSPKGPAQDSRSKALAFARRIPPPRTRPAAQPAPPPHDSPEAKTRRRAERRGSGLLEEDQARRRPKELTELEALEVLHDDMRRKVQAARTSF